MAGDWIKIREDLNEDPAVLRMAIAMNERPEHIVGYCTKFWAWISRNVSPESRDNCPAASVTGVPLLSLEVALNLPGFLTALLAVDWLEYDDGAGTADGQPIIHVPKLERHLSESAKKRALEAEKKRKQRAGKSPKAGDNCPKETGTREEKRREEKSKEKSKPKKTFQKPTVEQIREYCESKGFSFDPELFFDHYESNGWKVGKASMKDWMATARNWAKRESNRPKTAEPLSGLEANARKHGVIQ